jgi:predicted dienelactone hydrolase
MKQLKITQSNRPTRSSHHPFSCSRSCLAVIWLALLLFLLSPLLLIATPQLEKQKAKDKSTDLFGNTTTAAAIPTPDGYDPLKAHPNTTQTVLLEVQDKSRNRKIPLKIYLPETTRPAPVVLFSHGLGGNREASQFLGQHWAARGYLGVFLQHPGSDDSVWKQTPLRERMRAMNQAVHAENMEFRFRDVTTVLDQLEIWNQQPDHKLLGRCDLENIGMSGHSFGAVTTQGVSGQLFVGQPRFTDSRIKAAVIFSPGSPRIGNPQNAFGGVKLPWLLMTGTRDVAPIGNVDLDNRLAVFPALPADGCKYQLVLDQAEHSAFTDRSLPGERSRRNPNHHRAIQAISTCFWDAYLQKNSQAQSYLNDSNRIRELLEPNDRWDRK